MIDPQTQVTRISVSFTDTSVIFIVNNIHKLKVKKFSHVHRNTHLSQFQLRDVCQFAAHQENTRLMGFVVEGRDWSDGDEEGEPSFSAFVFESNTEGEKVGAPNAQRASQLLFTD